MHAATSADTVTDRIARGFGTRYATGAGGQLDSEGDTKSTFLYTFLFSKNEIRSRAGRRGPDRRRQSAESREGVSRLSCLEWRAAGGVWRDVDHGTRHDMDMGHVGAYVVWPPSPDSIPHSPLSAHATRSRDRAGHRRLLRPWSPRVHRISL